MNNEELSLKELLNDTVLIKEKEMVNNSGNLKGERLGIVYASTGTCLKLHNKSVEKLGNPKKVKFASIDGNLYIFSASDDDKAYDVPEKNESKYRIFYNTGLVSGIVDDFDLKYKINTPKDEFDDNNKKYSKSSKSFNDISYKTEDDLNVMIVKMS